MKKPRERSIDWDCMASLLRVAKSLSVNCLGENPRMGLYIIPWQKDDELICTSQSLADSILEVDCLDAIYEAGMVIFAVCWPGMLNSPTQLEFSHVVFQITTDGYLCESNIRVGRFIALRDAHQAFAVLPRWALFR